MCQTHALLLRALLCIPGFRPRSFLDKAPFSEQIFQVEVSVSLESVAMLAQTILAQTIVLLEAAAVFPCARRWLLANAFGKGLKFILQDESGLP